MNADRTSSVVALLGIVLAPLAAAAQQPAPPAQGQARYKKSEVEVTGVPQTQLTKPAAPPKETKKSGPVISLEEFVGQRQEKVVKLTDAQIEKLQRLIRITEDDDPQKPDFYFRLAEAFAEKQRFYFFQAMGLEEKIFQAPPAQKGQLQRQQADYQKEQEKWLLQAVATYIEASKFRKFPRMDEVLFKLAYLLQTVKKEDQAREFFHRLIKDYPNSKYVPEAYLSFAEYFFQKGEMDNALKFYARVEEFPKSPVYGYAVYKKGWCYVNQGDFSKALSIFIEVVNIAKQNKGGDPRQNKALEREAKKDMVKAYARVGQPSKAWDFFRRYGDDMAPKQMEWLGEVYWEQGMFKESTVIYRQLMDMNKASPRLCEWQNKVVRNTLSSGTKRDQVVEVARLGLAFDHVAKMQDVKKDIMDECRNSFHDTSKELALIWHKEAQKTKNPDTYVLVKSVYQTYLKYFSKEKGAIDMAFYFAEVLWVTEDWQAAAEQYTKVVEMDPKGKYVKEAAYAAVLAWKNALNIDDRGEGPDKDKQDGKDLKPKKIPEYQQKMIAAFDTYLNYVPDAPETVKIKYRKARIYYDYNHFDDAVKLFGDIVKNHVKDELAIYSANLMLDALNASGKHKEVVVWVDRFLQIPELMKDPEFQKQMVTIKIDSLDLEGREAQKRGQYKECGIAMLQAAESLPESPKHAERLYNAGNCFQDARLIGRAIQAREALLQAHPKDPLALKALYRIGANYQQIAFYTRAAEYYEQFATKYPGEKESATALANAYQFRVGMGDFEKAITDIDNFVKFYGDRQPQRAADVYYQKAEVFEKQNKTDELAKHLQSYLAKWGSKGGADKQVLAHFKLGEIAWKRSCPAEGVNGACIKIERVSATGRQKAIYDINKKIKDKRKKVKEKGRTQCGPPTRSKITIIERRKPQVAEAKKHFETALRLWRDGKGKISGGSPAEQLQRQGLAQYAAAGAQFYLAEMVYEDFLKVKFPEGLRFQAPTQWDPPRRAKEKEKRFKEEKKKFEAYLKQKADYTAKLAGAGQGKGGLYNFVTEYKVAHWTIAAAARIGQVYANFVDQLYTAEIPKDLKEMDEYGVPQKDLFCDALEDEAMKVEDKAVEAYDLCLKAATQQSWFNEWSAMCETELNQLKPSEYPLAVEAKPDPGFVSSLMTPAMVIQDLPSHVSSVVPAKE